MLRWLRVWFALSLPLGLFLGRFIAAEQRRRTRDKPTSGPDTRIRAPVKFHNYED